MDSPSRLSSAGPTRSRNLSTSSSADTLQLSPVNTRSTRSNKPTFSPYARPKENKDKVEGGIFSAVRGLPGRALGYLFRSSSVASLQSSLEESSVESTGTFKGRGLSPYASPVTGSRRLGRSKTSANLSSQLSNSESLTAFDAPPRSSHSTLTLPANGSTFTRSTAASPALSSASLSGRHRSPSPTRNNLAGTMSSFNLSELGANSSASTVFSSSKNYGLTSKSPFRTGAASTLPRSQSGNSLYPYSTSYSRGGSPTLSIAEEPMNYKRSRELSETGSPAPVFRGGWGRRAGSATGSSNGGPYNFVPSLQTNARQSSPLNHSFGGQDVSGMEPARKKKLLWDPEKGFIGREELELENSRARENDLPKNEAERILELLESMGRTPIGDASRGSSRPSIKVPIPSALSDFSTRTSTLSRSASTPLSPYSRRLKVGIESSPARSGTGLSSVFKARDDRRKAEEIAAREEREFRERERLEDEEREIERENQRQERQRQREMELTQEAMNIADTPRRKTRSMVKSESSAKLNSTKSPVKSKSSSRSKGKGKAKKDESDDDKSTIAEDTPMDSTTRTSRSRKSSRASPVPDIVEESIVIPPTPLAAPSFASTLLTVPVTGSSMRPARSHSSRTHTASSRVFSAREEDLPPVDEGNLGKIKLPPMVFPAGGFSFSAPKASVMDIEVEALKKPIEIKSTPLPPAIIPTPAKEIAPISMIPTNIASSLPTSSSISADFFSKPSTPTPTVTIPKLDSAPKNPSFFGAAFAAAPLPIAPVAAPFSFGAAPIRAVEPVKAVESKAEAPNPFTAFGGSINSVFESRPTLPAFTMTPSIEATSESSNSSGNVEVPKSSTSAFSATPTSTTSAFSFGAPAIEVKAVPKSAPFNFGAPSTGPVIPSVPLFGAPTNGFGGFGVAPPAIEDENDGDSGMEDNSPPRSSIALPTPAPFSFGAAPASAFPPANSFNAFGQQPPASVANPIPAPFSFGQAAPPAPVAASSFSAFGQPAATNSFSFGSNPSSPAPTTSSFSFGVPAAPSNPSPFSFGAPAPPTNNIFGANPPPITNSPFNFGSAPMTQTSSNPGFGLPPSTTPFGTNPSPFGANSFAPAPSTSAFAFGATSTSAPGSSSGAGFTFGAGPTAPATPNGATFNLGPGGSEAPASGRKIAPMRRRK